MKKRLYFTILFSSICLILMAENTPYISRVYEYVPAPGQFINVLPEYEEGDTESQMIQKVEAKIVGQSVNSTNYVCLGAWGGYITFGFDHPLVNMPGEYDLLIYGNAFKSGVPSDGLQFGSSEPGIVYVSVDTNGDGLPNDEWYEIAGSASDTANRHYAVTYGNAGAEDIPWEDNQGNTGYIARNAFHTQASYYPLWRTDKRYTLSGTLLEPNIIQQEGAPAPKAYMYEYGYADNWPNDDERAKIKLDWAIDAEGNPATLTHVDFIRVQTGVQVNWGISGEMSTEVCGAEDLHPAAIENALENIPQQHAQKVLLPSGRISLIINNISYDILGNKIQ